MDPELARLHEQYDFVAAGAMAQSTDFNDVGDPVISTEMPFELVPKQGDAVPRARQGANPKIKVSCQKQCPGTDECQPIGCLPLADASGCSNCHCDNSGEECPACSCVATITAEWN